MVPSCDFPWNLLCAFLCVRRFAPAARRAPPPPRPAARPPSPMVKPKRRKKKREKSVHLERRYHIHDPLRMKYSPREDGSPPSDDEEPRYNMCLHWFDSLFYICIVDFACSFVRHSAPVEQNLGILAAPSHSLSPPKLGAPKPLGHAQSGQLAAIGGHRSDELKPVHEENVIAEESDEKKHRHHKHKKKKKRKRRHRHKDSGTTSDSMPAPDVELAQKLVHNPSALFPPAEKTNPTKKSRKQLQLNDLQPAQSKQVAQSGHIMLSLIPRSHF